jgi:hypothetical protein
MEESRGKIMKKVWSVLFVGLLSQQAVAANIGIDVPGYSFAGIANTVHGSVGDFATNYGTPEASITDNLAATYVYSYGTYGVSTTGGSGIVNTTAYVDLSFGNDIFNGTGIDLSRFVVGANSQSIDITLLDTGAGTSSDTLTYDTVTYTGYNVDVDGKPPQAGVPDPDLGIFAMDVDLADFNYLGTNPVDIIRLGIDYGSAAPSLVGGYNAAAVPVPAAVWLFGSGLMALAGVVRKRA